MASSTKASMDHSGARSEQPGVVRAGRRIGEVVRQATAQKIALVVVLLVWPLVLHNNYWVSVMTTAGVYMILTLGVGLILGQAGQLSFGHAAFFGIGAYASGLLVTKAHWPTFWAWVAGAVAAALVALIVGRPVLKLRFFYLALATIGLVIIFLALMTNSVNFAGGAQGFFGVPALRIAGVSLSGFLQKYYLVWIVGLLILVFTDRLLKYRSGRALRALAVSETAAKTLGVRTANWKLLAFVVSALYCGIAGGLFVFVTGMGAPGSFGFSASILPMVMMLIGGAGLWPGIIGAIVMTWVVQGLGGAGRYSGLAYALILLFLLLFLPGGLKGGLRPEHRRRLKALFRLRQAPDVVACAAAALDDLPQGQCETTVGPVAAQQTVAPTELPLYSGGAEATSTERAHGEELLKIEGMTVAFGGLVAVNDVSLSVAEGTITALIGPNGAGKTTAFNAVSRLQALTGGTVWFGGRQVTKLSPANAARLGMARTFQNLRLFYNMSVFENVLVGRHRHERSGFLSGGLGLPMQRREERASRAAAMAALETMGLKHLADRPVTSLPYGQQRLVEIARALCSEPRLLLLDEPAAGMNPAERLELIDKIQRIRESGVTVLLVEHDVGLVMRVSDYVYVLDHGQLIAQGRPEEVRQDAAVIKAYIGSESKDKAARVCVEEQSPCERSDWLSIDDVTTSYGPIRAIRGVSLTVAEGELVAVVGANGAGKTTLLHTISGLLAPTSGRIEYRGTDLTKIAPSKIPALGLCQVPEGRQLFPTLTVEDNLVVGSSCRSDWRKTLRDDIARVYELFPILGERRLQAAGRLSGGEQQMLVIGRALIGRPQLLMLDEPSMGLAPIAAETIFGAIAKLNKEGVAILMVEQQVEMAVGLADRVVVLRTGEVVYTGDATGFEQDDRLRKAYLGEVSS